MRLKKALHAIYEELLQLIMDDSDDMLALRVFWRSAL